MDSERTPRASHDPVAERTPPLVKQNPPLPTGFQARAQQGPPLLSPRFPINNGSPGGPRPGAQPPYQQILSQRLESPRSPQGPPTVPDGQYVQSRPPFVPRTRPLNPQGNPNQIVRSPNPISTQAQGQGPPRYPGGPAPGSPGPRPPPNIFVGPRPPPVFPPNQQQQIYHQPRNGDARPWRAPVTLDAVGSPQPPSPGIRFSSFPQSPDIRQPPPRVIPDTAVTPRAKNDQRLRDDRTEGQASGQTARARATIHQGQDRGSMEVIESHSSSLADARASETTERKPRQEDRHDVTIGVRGPSPRAENDKEGDDDDDDVVMDSEKENHTNRSAASTPRTGTDEGSRSKPIRVDSPGSRDFHRDDSSTPSPVPSAEDQHRPTSHVAKIEKDERLPMTPPIEHQERSASVSPLPQTDKSDKTSRSESRLEERSKSPDQSINDDSTDFEINETISRTSEPAGTGINDAIADRGRSDSRAGGIRSARSPVPPSTLDNPTNLSVPPSPSPRSSASPRSPKSPQSSRSPVGSVKGFDDGLPRSLSPSPSVGSVSETSPNSPTIHGKSAGGDGKRATFAEEIKTAGEMPRKMNETESTNGLKTRPATPGGPQARERPSTPSSKLGERAPTPATPDGRKSSASIKRSTSGRSIKSDAGSEGGPDDTRQATPKTNGVALSPTKKLPPKSMENDKRPPSIGSPIKSPSKSLKSLPRTPEAGPPSTAEKKKVPMNKVQVGAAPSPNLKTVRSKIGSLDNASYKPGGGKIKIENRKLDFSKAQPKIAAKNDKYTPSGGDKKITQVKLQWNAKPKVGSLDNATYKPGGGDKKIETVKLAFKDKAKPKVGSKENAKHVPGGGTVKVTITENGEDRMPSRRLLDESPTTEDESSSTPPKTPQDQPNEIETQKIDIKAESKIGSLENVKHKPGGGDKKIFNDKDYLRQTGSNVESHNGSGAQSPVPPGVIGDGKNDLPTSDENLNEEC